MFGIACMLFAINISIILAGKAIADAIAQHGQFARLNFPICPTCGGRRWVWGRDMAPFKKPCPDCKTCECETNANNMELTSLPKEHRWQCPKCGQKFFEHDGAMCKVKKGDSK